MAHQTVALVDCDAFYCSCETLFMPGLKGKPVGVLSNNDGNLISRNRACKQLGIPMGAPLHQVLPFVEHKGLHLFSCNLPLYGDISARVMQTLSQFSPKPLVLQCHLQNHAEEEYGTSGATKTWRTCSQTPTVRQR